MFLFKQGTNTAMVAEPGNRAVIAHDAQLALPAVEPPPEPERRMLPPRARKQTDFYGPVISH